MTMLLSAGELASIRATRNGFLPDTAILYRHTLTGDGMGGRSESWAAVGTVSCYVWTRESLDSEIVVGGQVTSRTRWYIEVPYNTTIDARDRVDVGDRTFTVTTVPNDASILTGLRLEVVALNEEQRV